MMKDNISSFNTSTSSAASRELKHINNSLPSSTDCLFIDNNEQRVEEEGWLQIHSRKVWGIVSESSVMWMFALHPGNTKSICIRGHLSYTSYLRTIPSCMHPLFASRRFHPRLRVLYSLSVHSFMHNRRAVVAETLELRGRHTLIERRIC